VVIALWLGNAGHAVFGALAPGGQHLKEFGELGLAFVLSSLIGLEREWRQKSAGLCTNALVGTGAALFLLVSKYGFGDIVLGKGGGARSVAGGGSDRLGYRLHRGRAHIRSR